MLGSQLRWLHRSSADPSILSLTDALNLHETDSSLQVPDAATAAQVTLQDSSGSATRFLEVVASGAVLRVGGADFRRPRTLRSLHRNRNGNRTVSMDKPTTKPDRGGTLNDAAVIGEVGSAGSMLDPEGGEGDTPSKGASAGVFDADEGTRPVRFPSLDAEGTITAGQPVTIVVDLLREASLHTAGGPLTTDEQPTDWRSLLLTVTLLSPAIDFDGIASGTVTIQRNGTSISARISGTLRADVAPDSEIDVAAQFWAGTRLSGFAMRKFRASLCDAAATVSAATDTSATPPSAPSVPRRVQAAPVTSGAVQVETAAQALDFAVYITVTDANAPGVLHWRMITATFDRRQPKLDGKVDLGTDLSSEAAAMFKHFAKLERGKHRRMIDSFGQALWQCAPEEFRLVYWALHDHLKWRLTIRFISDDPHLPWELMAPFRNSEGMRRPPCSIALAAGSAVMPA